MTFHDPQRQDEASRIRAQLEAIDIERLRLEARLREIESEQEPSPPASLAAIVTNEFPAADKIALFRRLFAGRTDVATRHCQKHGRMPSGIDGDEVGLGQVGIAVGKMAPAWSISWAST